MAGRAPAKRDCALEPVVVRAVLEQIVGELVREGEGELRGSGAASGWAEAPRRDNAAARRSVARARALW
eukprot:2964950-Prymnesium_polylepis.3